VYEAHDRLFARIVPIKVFAPAFDRDRRFVERFRRGARAAARLNYPYIVAAFDRISHVVADSGRRGLVCTVREARSSRYVCPWPFWP
jgi:hypothetical protein